jgi:hypothetical protein
MVRQRLALVGIERDGFVADVTARVPSGTSAPVGHIPFTPRSKIILATASTVAGGPVEPRHIARATLGLADGLAAELVRARTGLSQDRLVAEADRVLADTGRDALVASAPSDQGSLRCSFCGQGHEEVQKLIAGPGMYICDQCVDLCNKIIADEVGPDRKRIAERIDRLAADLDQLRRDFDAGA